MPMPARQEKVVVIPFALNQLIASSGGANNSNWTWLELPLDEVAEWGPHLASITAHTNTQSATPLVQWKILFWWSVDGKVWVGNAGNGIELFAPVTASGQAIQLPYSTTGNFGLKLRFAIAVRAASGTTVESAMVGGALAFEFRS